MEASLYHLIYYTEVHGEDTEVHREKITALSDPYLLTFNFLLSAFNIQIQTYLHQTVQGH